MGDEIKAMGSINQALEGLDADEKRRVLSWALDKHGGGATTLSPASAPAKAGTGDEDEDVPGADTKEFERISDLVDAAEPQSIVDYVLVGSYWFQVVEGQENVTGMQVNDALKDLGHPSSNITDSFSSLMARKHARQVQKSGTSKQARKRYRLTEEGIRAVQKLIAHD